MLDLNTLGSLLYQVEKKHNVKILFSVESGSRAWGFSSLDSDYDVRFVYYRPSDYYYSIYKRSLVLDVNNLDLDPEWNDLMTRHNIDLAGWDLVKSYGLMANGNQTLQEWTNSPIVYGGNEFLEKSPLRQHLTKFFSPKSSINHYRSMAKSDGKHAEDKTTLKRALYFFRAVLAAHYILHEGRNPPVDFGQLVLAGAYDLRYKSEVERVYHSLLERKTASIENETEFWSLVDPTSVVKTLFGQIPSPEDTEIFDRRGQAEFHLHEMKRWISESVQNLPMTISDPHPDGALSYNNGQNLTLKIDLSLAYDADAE